MMDRGQVLEQRVTDVRRQYIVARLGQQHEQQTIRLARAGGDEDIVKCEGQRRRAPGVIACDRRARRRGAARVGVVAARAPVVVGGGAQQIGGEDQALVRRVAAGQIDIAGAGRGALARQLDPVGGQVAIGEETDH